MNAGQLVVVIDSNIFVHGGLFNHDGDASERCITAVLSSALPSSHRPFEQVLLSLTFTLSAFQVSGSNFDFFTKSHDHICIFFQSAFVYSINLFCAPSLRLTLFMLCRDVLVGPSDAHMFEWLTGFQFPISVCDFSLRFQFAISVCDFSLRFQFAISVCDFSLRFQFRALALTSVLCSSEPLDPPSLRRQRLQRSLWLLVRQRPRDCDAWPHARSHVQVERGMQYHCRKQVMLYRAMVPPETVVQQCRSWGICRVMCGHTPIGALPSVYGEALQVQPTLFATVLGCCQLCLF
jgi:hypothetical protein